MASTERLHALLQSILAERDRFAAHLYQSRREYRRASETTGKSGKRIERCVISTFQIAGKWVSMATFGNGSICFELETDLIPRRSRNPSDPVPQSSEIFVIERQATNVFIKIDRMLEFLIRSVGLSDTQLSRSLFGSFNVP
jgi:hypothetical protein